MSPDEKGNGAVAVRVRLNRAPSREWEALFKFVQLERMASPVWRAHSPKELTLDAACIDYTTTEANGEVFHDLLRKVLEDTNGRAAEQNAKARAAQDEDVSGAEARKASFEAFRKRMTGK